MPPTIVKHGVAKSGWMINVSVQNATTARVALAAVTGKKHVITSLHIVCDVAETVTIQSKPSGSAVTMIGGIPFAASRRHFKRVFPKGIFGEVAGNLQVLVGGIGDVFICFQGYTK